MKKRRLKIKAVLFCMLAVIMSSLISVYAVFCRGGENYNIIKIEAETAAEKPSDEPPPQEEPATEPVSEDTASEPVSEPVSEEATSEDATEDVMMDPSRYWKSYRPAENLAGDNWALTLINSEYPLGKGYSPTLAPVIEASSVTADSRVAEAYKEMYAHAMAQGIALTPYSGYCSVQRQQSNFNNKVEAFVLQGMSRDEAIKNAEKRIEQGGSSENNAGLAVDIISASAGFASTKEYKWLTENAHKYGFVLRYPQDKTEITGMIYQPWHWRYVGIEAAGQMKSSNQCLEEYLGAASVNATE